MLSKDEIAAIVEDYDRMKLRIGMTASHSALDICDGAIEEGFPTVAYCKEGRHKTYANYFKAQRSSSGRVVRGMVDKAIVMPSFNDVMNADMQEEMRRQRIVRGVLRLHLELAWCPSGGGLASACVPLGKVLVLIR